MYVKNTSSGKIKDQKCYRPWFHMLCQWANLIYKLCVKTTNLSRNCAIMTILKTKQINQMCFLAYRWLGRSHKRSESQTCWRAKTINSGRYSMSPMQKGLCRIATTMDYPLLSQSNLHNSLAYSKKGCTPVYVLPVQHAYTKVHDKAGKILTIR